LLAAVAGLLTLTKKRRMAHDRLFRVFERHLSDVVVVVGDAYHQTRALAEKSGGLLQFMEHGNALIVVGDRAMKAHFCIWNVSVRQCVQYPPSTATHNL
jgi:metallophosphoesterase superfamily enzyme